MAKASISWAAFMRNVSIVIVDVVFERKVLANSPEYLFGFCAGFGIEGYEIVE